MTNVNPGNGNRDNSGKGADRARDLYEEAADGSFDEAFEEFYDEPAAGRHQRVERVEDVEFEDVEGYEDYDDYDQDGYADEPYDYVAELEESEEDDRGGVLAAGAMGASIAESDAAAAGAAGAGAGAGAAGAGAGTVSSSAATGSGAALAGGAAAVSGVPKRGLAMILIAVAILLGLWGVYAMTQSGKDGGDTTAQEQQNQQEQQGQNQGQNQGRNPGDTNRGPNSGNPVDPADPADPNSPAEGTEGADQAGTDGADGATNNNEPMTAENETVNVFNNSTVPNLAADVSGTLKDQGTRIGEVGNITEAQAILTENTVFFDPATPGAEERARVLAERVGGVAKPNDASVPENAAKPGSLTLVLTGPVAL